MRETFLPFSPPNIGEEEIQEVVDTLRSGWITTGPKAKQFEQDFSKHFGAPAALGLNSCTAGLHLALLALGIGPGDEVITTPMTFCASANVIEHVGARPVLVDVEADTLNIAPLEVEKAATAKTKAVLVVHYAGHPVELDSIRAFVQARGIALIEDAAHAVGAKYKGRYIGASENPVAFSFYATKNLTTGEGGMLTGTEALLDDARVLSLHGMSRDAWRRYDKGGSWYYEVVQPGFKYNMTDIQAALGLWQLRKFDGFQERRREIADMYLRAFSSESALEPPIERPEVSHAWHLLVLRLVDGALKISRAQFIAELAEANVGTSVHFIPIHLHPYYAQRYGLAPHDFPVAFQNYERMLSIPLNVTLSNDDVGSVINSVLDIVGRHKR